MTIKNFRSDYLAQLQRPKPKRYKGKTSLDYNFEKRYNNDWSINERIARYQNRLKRAELSKTKHLNKYINSLTKFLFDMKNDNLNDLLRSNQETVTVNLTKKFGSLDYSVINWSIVDYSTQENFRASFREAMPNELAKQLDDIEAEHDNIKREANKELRRKLANLTPEQLEALIAKL